MTYYEVRVYGLDMAILFTEQIAMLIDILNNVIREYGNLHRVEILKITRNKNVCFYRDGNYLKELVEC